MEAAEGGSLFLDEIGDVDLSVQPKLLKVLEEGSYRRLGETRERRARVRLLAATHHDLLRASRDGRFRADLYYRISTVTLTLPPLRERPEDIVSLAREMASRFAGHPVELADDAIDKLSTYRWPGNIRELKNVVERSILLAGDELITAESIVLDVSQDSVRPPPVSSRGGRFLAADASLATRVEVEREHIELALAAERGRVEAAARRLGIPRSTMYWKLRKLGISSARTKVR